jgi:hypothetical protein
MNFRDAARSLVTKALCALLLLPIGTLADQYIQQGEYFIYYSTVKSTLIPKEVASLHGISRSDSRYLINISIKRDGKAVTADVSGYGTNLLNQSLPLKFQEVREQSAVYYLANTVIGKNETMRFEINLQIRDAQTPIKFKFEKRFF